MVCFFSFFVCCEAVGGDPQILWGTIPSNNVQRYCEQRNPTFAIQKHIYRLGSRCSLRPESIKTLQLVEGDNPYQSYFFFQMESAGQCGVKITFHVRMSPRCHCIFLKIIHSRAGASAAKPFEILETYIRSWEDH